MPASTSDRAVSRWLLLCCGLVLAMVVTGGITRLTRSGLSIVEWRPVTGAIPPLDRAAWELEFEKYRRTPEWLQLNGDMTLDGFQSIYWMEYFHRLLGRVSGLAFVLPLLWFALKRRLDARLRPRLWAIALLWALQGFLGWFMVASGLVHIPRVSPYRLTLHLLAACLLFGTMFWTAYRAAEAKEGERPRDPARAAWAVLGLAVAAIATGGLVAGLKAGFLYRTFPLLAGNWIPPMLLELEPKLRNFFENELTVQFEHRLLGLGLLLATGLLWTGAARRGGPTAAPKLLFAAVVVQAGLGIATLLAGVPVSLGVAHQANAFLVLAAALHAILARPLPEKG